MEEMEASLFNKEAYQIKADEFESKLMNKLI
jgi:hypothetical protein